MTQVIQNVSDTAFMVAGFRAAENERPNPLFRDPLAARLAGEHGGEILATMPYSVVGAWSVVIRTVIIDDSSHARLEKASIPSSISAQDSIRDPTAWRYRKISAGWRWTIRM